MAAMTEILRYAAFTTDPKTGNPAGVVLDADLSTKQMQSIATDIGYSETAFLNREQPETDRTGTDEVSDRYSVRYFSPLAEVAFCGHATVASAIALAERGARGSLRFSTLAGEIDVSLTQEANRPMATLTSVATRSTPAGTGALTQALAALRWSADDLNAEFPPHVAFAGNDHLVLAAASRQRLAQLDYDFAALKSVMQEQNWTTVQLFWPETANLIHSRNPFPVGGVVEDPATGAAAAALGGYLLTLGLVEFPRQIRIIQGEDMGRRSELGLRLAPDDTRVKVSGTASPMRG